MPGSHEQRILLVDASDAERSLARYALLGEYHVDEAKNGADALLALSKRRYACLVTDLELPDMTGLDLVEMARRGRHRRTVRALLLVPPAWHGRHGPDGLPMGADEQLLKPFHPKDLHDAVTRLAGPSRHAKAAPSLPGVQAILESFPQPAMVLDAHHRVWLANGAFYQAAGAAIDGCFVDCAQAMHGADGIPEGCPLEESKRVGGPAEREIDIRPLGTLRVSVYPLDRRTPDGLEMYLHVTTLRRDSAGLPLPDSVEETTAA